MKKFKKLFIVLSLTLSLISLNLVRVNAATVATMRIYSVYDTGKMHSWISINNRTSSTQTIGRYSLPAGAQVTIGTWGNLQYKGIWYNVEALRKLTDHVSTAIDLSSSQLSTVSSTIRNNNSWSAVNNCSTFAVKVWNSVASTKLSAGVPNLPTQLSQDIRNKTTYKHDFAMDDKTDKHTYATVKGASEYIVQVKPIGGSSSSFSSLDVNTINNQYQLNLVMD